MVRAQTDVLEVVAWLLFGCCSSFSLACLKVLRSLAERVRLKIGLIDPGHGIDCVVWQTETDAKPEC